MNEYRIHIGNESYDILREGFSLPSVAGALGKHEQASASFSVRDPDFIGMVFSAESALEGYITRNGAKIFTGTIRPYTTLNPRAMDLGPVSVELLDNTEKLHVYVKEGMAEIFASETLKSLTNKLIAKAGVNFSVAEIADSTQIVRFALDEGTYIDEVLSDLLWQYGYDYSFTPEGNLYFFSTKLDGSSVTEVSSFVGGVAIERSDDSTDGVIVEYREAVNAGRMVTVSQEFYENSILPFSTVFGYYDAEGTVTASGLADRLGLEPGSIEWFTTSSPSFYVNYDHLGSYNPNGSTVTMDSFGNYKIRMRGFWNALWAGVTTLYVHVTAIVSFIKKANVRYMTEGDKPVTYNASAVYDNNIARALAEREYLRQKTSTTKYRFSSFDTYSVGSLVTLKDSSVSGLDVKVRVLRRTLEDDTGLFRYDCEGADQLSLTPPSEIVTPSDVVIRPTYLAMSITEADYTPEALSKIDHLSVSAYGSDVDAGSTVTWTLNGDKIGTGINIQIASSLLKPGRNTLIAKTTSHSAAGIINVEAEGELLVEYSYGDSTLDPPSEGWYSRAEAAQVYSDYVIYLGDDIVDIDESDVMFLGEKDGKYLWQRQRKSEAESWLYVRMTGSEGKGSGEFYGIGYSPNPQRVYSQGDHYMTASGVPMIYDSGWKEMSASVNPTQFSACANAWLNSGEPITESMTALYAYVQNLFANSAVINSMFSTMITLLQGGEIKSENYVSGQDGFKITSDGTAEFIDANFIHCTFAGEGIMDCPTFESRPRKEGEGGETRQSDTESSAEGQFNALERVYSALGLSENAYYSCVCSSSSLVKYVKKYSNGSSYIYYEFFNAELSRIFGTSKSRSGFGTNIFLSDFANLPTWFEITSASGDIFLFKNIPTNTTNLPTGAVYSDGGTLKIKM